MVARGGVTAHPNGAANISRRGRDRYPMPPGRSEIDHVRTVTRAGHEDQLRTSREDLVFDPANQTIVWAAMTVLVVIPVLATVALRRAVLFRPNVSIPSLAATGAVALGLQPTLSALQRCVHHLLGGDRDEPYRVVARLRDVLVDTVDPLAVPALLTETIARSLRVPYVAVETYGRHGPRVIAEHGLPGQAPDAFDLLCHAQPIGRLLVAPRNSGGRFTRRERMVLADVALHAAAAVAITLLLQDLRESRERLMVAHEEERRRLRRDLHDGLGQSVAGLCMQVRAAQRVIAPQTQATTILNELADDLQTCTAEVLRLVDPTAPTRPRP
jgi:two-component system NarL family sensor kinase